MTTSNIHTCMINYKTQSNNNDSLWIPDTAEIGTTGRLLPSKTGSKNPLTTKNMYRYFSKNVQLFIFEIPCFSPRDMIIKRLTCTQSFSLCFLNGKTAFPQTLHLQRIVHCKSTLKNKIFDY